MQDAYLVEVIKNYAKLSKLLDPSRYIDITVEINGQRRLVDDCLHARHSEVVVAVVKPGVDQSFLTEAEDLPTCQRAYAERSECVSMCMDFTHNTTHTQRSQLAITLPIQACLINSNQGLIQHH